MEEQENLNYEGAVCANENENQETNGINDGACNTEESIRSKFWKFIGIKNGKEIVEQTGEFARHEFEKFCAILSVFVSIIYVLGRTCVYTYQSTRLAIYHIDMCQYVDNDNWIYQLIQSIVIAVLVFACNFGYFCARKKTKLIVIESIFTFVGVGIFSGVFWDMIKLFLYHKEQWLKYIVIFIIMCFLSIATVVACNLYAIVQCKSIRNTGVVSSETNDECSTSRINNVVVIVVAGISISVFLIFLSLGMGNLNEKNKSEYKVVEQLLKEDEISKYKEDRLFPAIEQHNGNSEEKYLRYAIVYENEDKYMLCPLSLQDGELYLDENMLMMVSNDELTTYVLSYIQKSE